MQTCTSPDMRALVATLRTASETLTASQAMVRIALEELKERVAEAETQVTESAPAKTASTLAPPPPKAGPLSTAQLAAALGRAKSTIRRRLCDTGSYFGLVPIKLPTGRLLWPEDSLEQLSRSRSGK